MNQTNLEQFKEKTNIILKETQIDINSIFEICDQDSDGLLNEIEFLDFFKQFNSNFDDDYLLQLHFSLIKDFQQVNIHTLKKFFNNEKLESPELENYLEYLHLKNETFDKGFPHNNDSLGKFEKQCSWKQILERTIFKEGSKILPRQGKLGNCYLIAPLASFYYTHPDQIKSLIIDQQNNLICTRLCIDGQWRAIWVDYYFPVIKNKEKIAFTKCLDGAIWAMVIEKAFAKIYGSYESIAGGYSRTTLRSLCGAPSQKIRTLDQDFIRQINFWAEKNYPMAANSRKRDRLDQINQEEGKEGSSGLSANHNYSVLKIKNNQIKVRNPWGFRKWKQRYIFLIFLRGDALEQSNYENDIKKKQKQESGIFYIDFNNFMKYFASVEVCFFNPTYCYLSQVIQTSKKDIAFFDIEVLIEGEYYFTVNQRNKRWFRQCKQLNYKISPSEICILNETYQILRMNKQKNEKETWIHIYLKQRKYKLYCSVKWIPFESSQFILSSYGISKIHLNYIGNNIINIKQLVKAPEEKYPILLVEQISSDEQQKKEEKQLQFKQFFE